jgi:hypothetical protein
MVDLLDKFVDQEFANASVMDNVFVSDNFEELITQLQASSGVQSLEEAN